MLKPVTFLFSCMENRQNFVVHGTAFIILLAGLLYSIHLGNHLIYPDAKLYYAIAVNVAGGHGYSLNGIEPTAYFTPGYPLFLALFLKCGASIIVLRYLNFIILAACVYVVRSILRSSNGAAGAPLSAILLLSYGVLFYTAGTLYTQTLYTLLLLLNIRLAIVPRFGYRHALLLGILSALIIMVHPTGVLIPPLIVLWLFFPANRHIIGKGAFAALVAVVCISPWAYRNYQLFDRFIPITSHGADTLFVGNNPQTSLDEWYKYTETNAYREANKLPLEEQNSYYMKQIVAFWTNQTGDAVRLYFLKLVDYFNYRNNLSTRSESSGLRDVIMFITYYPLLLCLVLRLLFTAEIPLSRIETLLVTIYLASALFHAVFIPRIRFRLPYDTVLITHIGIMYALLKDQKFKYDER
jgi:hypothetical protein